MPVKNSAIGADNHLDSAELTALSWYNKPLNIFDIWDYFVCNFIGLYYLKDKFERKLSSVKKVDINKNKIASVTVAQSKQNVKKKQEAGRNKKNNYCGVSL